MHLVYLPANQAWVFVFGDVLTGPITDMGGYGRFFNLRHNAVVAANACGLVVDKDGEVRCG